MLKQGTCTLTAAQSGNGNYNAATSVTQSFDISLATQASFSISSSSAITYNSTLSLTTSGGSGTGGVSLFALKFAKMLGAWVVITSSSDEKLARARTLGADATINYRTQPEWHVPVKELTQGQGVDHVVEVGGGLTLAPSLKAVRTGGTLSLIGVLSGGQYNIPVGPVVTRQVRLQGISVGSRDGFEAMARAVGQHGIRPEIDRVFPFEELRQALEHLASGAHFGKVCVQF